MYTDIYSVFFFFSQELYPQNLYRKNVWLILSLRLGYLIGWRALSTFICLQTLSHQSMRIGKNVYLVGLYILTILILTCFGINIFAKFLMLLLRFTNMVIPVIKKFLIL